MAFQSSAWALRSPSPSGFRSAPRNLSRPCSKSQLDLQRNAKEGNFSVVGFPNSAQKSRDRASLVQPPRCGLDVVAPTVGTVTEVDKDTFWPLVKGAGEKIVVLDMYTQWCGPCKVIAPKFKELSEKHLDVVFLKLDCNQENKPLAKELGIKVVPTFKIIKGGEIVKEVRGAKYDDLVLAIETAKTS
ncbi:thioredoxin F1, chloroplastic-like [Wolffia australiana]